MRIKDTFLALVLLAGIHLIVADKDDDDDHSDDDHSDDDDDDDGRPHYCPKPNGMFPNPTDCTLFYNCVDGTAIPMSCAPGLLFDPKNKMCNFPSQTKCSNQCQGPSGLFPSQHRCDEFVLCTNNKPKVKRCKKGLYFDPNLQVCNFKGQVVCNLPGSGSKGNKTEGNKSKSKRKKSYDRNDIKEDDEKVEVGQFMTGGNRYSSEGEEGRKGLAQLVASSVRSVCPGKRGLFAHAESCEKFYQCWDGEVVVKSCPEGLLFHEARHTCAYPKEVSCGRRHQPRNSYYQ